MRVYYEDTDAGGIVYHATYLRFMERARTDLLRRVGFSHQRLTRDFATMIVVESLEIRFVRPAMLDDLLEVSAGIAESRRASVVFAQEVRRDGELIATASVRAACLAIDTRRPVAIPEPLRRLFQEST